MIASLAGAVRDWNMADFGACFGLSGTEAEELAQELAAEKDEIVACMRGATLGGVAATSRGALPPAVAAAARRATRRTSFSRPPAPHRVSRTGPERTGWTVSAGWRSRLGSWQARDLEGAGRA